MYPPADHGESSYIGTGRLLGQVGIIYRRRQRLCDRIAFAQEGADTVLSYLPEEGADALEVSSIIHEFGRKALAYMQAHICHCHPITRVTWEE